MLGSEIQRERAENTAQVSHVSSNIIKPHISTQPSQQAKAKMLRFRRVSISQSSHESTVLNSTVWVAGRYTTNDASLGKDPGLREQHPLSSQRYCSVRSARTATCGKG